MRILTILFAMFSLVVAIVSFPLSWMFMLLALQEGLQAIFLLCQKKARFRANTWTIWPYLLIFLVLATGRVQVDGTMQGISLVMMLAGIFLVLWALFSLRRNFGIFAEVREVVTTGPYRYMRHPMYVGYGLQYLAIALNGNFVTWMLVFVLIVLQYIRARQEMKVLQKIPEYQKYMETVHF